MLDRDGVEVMPTPRARLLSVDLILPRFPFFCFFRLSSPRRAQVARATTLVRYEPGMKFPAHVHNGGEEFIVLEGTFSDASGDYHEGAYGEQGMIASEPPSSQPLLLLSI
jgi:hypothetical protein